MAERLASMSGRRAKARAIAMTREADLSHRIFTSLIALTGLAATLLILTSP